MNKVCTKCNNEKSLTSYGLTSKGTVCSQCKECVAIYQAEYRAKTCDKRKAAHAAWRLKNREKVRAYHKTGYEANIVQIHEQHRKYKSANRDKVRSQNAAYQQRKKAEDPLFKMKANVRNLVSSALRRKGFVKRCKTLEIVGKFGHELYEHLMHGFQAVYGRLPSEHDELDIDHVIPLATATTEEEVLKLNHYTNLRFLLRDDNRWAKGAKLDWSLDGNL